MTPKNGRMLPIIAAALTIVASGCSHEQRAEIQQRVQSSATWSGDVDDTATVYFQGGKSWVDDVTGKPVLATATVFQGTLPSAEATVKLDTKSGRGQVAITQQPTRDNNYTAAVRIVDPQPSSDHYTFRLVW